MLSIVEAKLLSTEDSLRVRKRVMNVLIESLQNMYHHGGTGVILSDEEMKKMSGKLLITKADGVYSVLVGNLISNNAAKELESKIKNINTLTRKGLTEEYRKVLDNGIRSSKGGGGLGVMNMARKSGEHLEFNFVPIDSKSSFFSLKIKIKH